MTDLSLAKMRARIEAAEGKGFLASVPGAAMLAMIDELQAGRGKAEFLRDAENMIHIAGHPVRVGPVMKQRCAWCGYMIAEYDLRLIAVPNKDDGSPGDPPGSYPEGDLIRVSSTPGMRSQIVVEHKDGDPLP